MSTTGELLEVTKGSSLESQVITMDSLHFPWPWSADQWNSLDRNIFLIWSWQINEIPEGFALFSHSPNDDAAHLLKFFITNDFRGTGQSLAFWNKILAQLKSRLIVNIFLEVEEANLSAIGFYRKVGLKELRRMKGYYSDGSNALSMMLML